MKERPILFNTEMVKAVLEGRKTETRRVVKGQIPEYAKSPYGMPGDTLWVRETWARTEWLHPSDPNYGYIYKASENGKDWEENSEEWKWKPSIHMPKDAARIWLEVVEVKTERVQDITKESIIAEGVQVPMHNNRPLIPLTTKHFPIEYFPNGDIPSIDKVFEAFWIELWDSINSERTDKEGKSLNYDWKSNPWVWVVKFKVLSTKGKP